MNSAACRVVFVGNPNTGKSTLFGALSGLHVQVANYPGVTIEKKIGHQNWDGVAVELVDLPGTYSLSPRSPDELVAVEVLTGDYHREPPPDLVVCVVNACLLRRNLFLVSQLLELGKPVIVALNMIDAAEARGIQVDAAQLAKNLGCPVYAVSAVKRAGLAELKSGIVQALQTPPAIPNGRSLPDTFYNTADRLGEQLAALALTSPAGATATALPSRYLLQRALLDEGGEAEKRLTQITGTPGRQRITDSRAQLQAELGPLNEVECDSRYAWAKRQLDGVLPTAPPTPHVVTQRMDGVLIHRVWGMVCFAALMFLIFQCIYAWSGYPMDFIAEKQSQLTGLVESLIGPGTLRSLLVDGIIAGVGGVVIFVPQIALLFLFLAILEDCGYIARAAYLIDRVMASFGLSGKSFLPLMSSFACAIPGVMAARVIENRRERFITMLIAPLMNCSARLPVYLLLIAAFVPPASYLGGWVSLPGLVLMAMYLVGVVVAIPTAWVLQKTVLKGPPSPLVLELPDYKWPSIRVVFTRVWLACREFIVRAGTLIFAATILIWAAAYWPGDHARQHELQRLIEANQEQPEEQLEPWIAELNAESANLLEHSLLGRIGHGIEPVVRPLGWDWKLGVGAVASFPAREVIIATLGTIYSLGGEVDEEDESLIDALHAATWPDGRPVYNLPVALSVMVFFALCAQCMTTLLVIQRETNSWRWPVFSFTYMTVLAYIGAFLTYQIASRII